MFKSSFILLCVIFVQNTYGTFPPVNNPPPIPSQAVRGLPPQNFNIPEDLSQFPPLPREERIFSTDRKPEEERWYYEERQSRESRNGQGSFEISDRYYQRDEPTIGPVATPIPDDAYLAQSSSITRLNPADIQNRDNDKVLIFTSDDGQYRPERWVEVQIPNERLIEVVNQDSGIPIATDTVKSIAAPAPFDIPPQTQFSPNPSINVIQAPQANSAGFQKVYTNSRTVIESVPAVKQFVGIQSLPPLNVKNVKQQIISDTAPVALPPPPVSPQISSKTAFSVPPPLPPPLKGSNAPPKVISSVPVNIISDSNVVLPNKNVIPDSNIVPGKSVVQQIRHIWIPTSAKTGKFITIPVRSANLEKSTVNKGFSLESTPVTVSDTWVLKQDGPVPVFEQQKSAISPVSLPIVQSGKVIFESPTIVQVEGPPNSVVSKVDSPKNVPGTEKIVVPNTSRDIWPARKVVTSAKLSNNYAPVIISDVPGVSGKSDAVVNGKYISEILPAPQKTIVSDVKPDIPPPVPSSNIQIVNGKPCPLPLPRSQTLSLPSYNNGIIALQRIVPTQRRLPFARIIRVNRYPMGSYYLLNKDIRPSYFMYPSQTITQQPKTGLISIVQTKQLPVQLQKNVPLPPIQTKQISIPVQSKQFASSLSGKPLSYPFISRQVILPVASPKSTRIFYPSIQAIRPMAYPWNGNLKSSPVFYRGVYGPEFGTLKAASAGSESESSSSESSSSEESSESSKEKKEKPKKLKAKKEEKSKSIEDSKSSENERETESNSKSKENESKEKSSERSSEESLETSESQASLSFYKTNDEVQYVTSENAHVNIVSSHGAVISEETLSSKENEK